MFRGHASAHANCGLCTLPGGTYVRLRVCFIFRVFACSASLAVEYVPCEEYRSPTAAGEVLQEEVQLREQDFGNFQDAALKAAEKSERLKYGRFFYRFPNGESGADVYDRCPLPAHPLLVFILAVADSPR